MASVVIGAFAAKPACRSCLDKVAKGRRYRITKRGKPVAEFVPIVERRRRPGFGSDRGRVAMRADLDDPLDDFAAYK